MPALTPSKTTHDQDHQKQHVAWKILLDTPATTLMMSLVHANAHSILLLMRKHAIICVITDYYWHNSPLQQKKTNTLYFDLQAPSIPVCLCILKVQFNDFNI